MVKNPLNCESGKKETRYSAEHDNGRTNNAKAFQTATSKILLLQSRVPCFSEKGHGLLRHSYPQLYL